MHITITGDIGSGKSSIANILRDEYGFKKYYVGDAQRKIASDLGMTVLELNKYMEKHLNNKYDKMLDGEMVNYAKEHAGENIVFDSRLGWHFVPDSFKIYVIVDPNVAVKRIMSVDRSGSAEGYSDEEEALTSIRMRKAIENRRFKLMYGVDMKDLNNFDLVIESTNNTPDILAKIIMVEVEKLIKMRENYAEAYSTIPSTLRYPTRLLIDPKRLYPVESVVAMNKDWVDSIASKDVGYINSPIEVTYDHHGEYFIVDGHHRVCASIQNDKTLVAAYINNDAHTITILGKADYCEWEKLNKFKYREYPGHLSNVLECPQCGSLDTLSLSTNARCFSCDYEWKAK